MYAVVDTGTTNTRIYIVNRRGQIVGRAYRKVGVRDTAITGSTLALTEGLVACFQDAVDSCGLTVQDIQFAFVSGMLTSEIGLIDLPHITAPAGKDELASQCVIMNHPSVFPIPIPAIFIRGIKNNASPTFSEIGNMDFMRGEETQVMGVLHRLRPTLPCYIVFLTSHTKIIEIDDRARICRSMTTLSGQIFEAIKKETMIGKSVCNPSGRESRNKREILEAVWASEEANGLLRTLMMPRYMEVLMDSEESDRAYCLDAAIACDDMKTICSLLQHAGHAEVVLVGHENRCELYQTLLEFCQPGISVRCIHDKQEIDQLTVNGAISLLEKIQFPLQKT